MLGDQERMQERMPVSLEETRPIDGQGPSNLISFTNVRVQILIMKTSPEEFTFCRKGRLIMITDDALGAIIK